MHKPAPVLRLAWRELRQGWRHFATFLACLVLGVCVITTIGTISAAVEDSLENEATALLGGDVEVGLRSYSFAPEHIAYLQEAGNISHIATMRSMLRVGEQTPLLVELKAVDAAYPLVGELIINGHALDSNHIAVDQSLLDQLGITAGATVRLGQADYVIGGVLEREPDRVVQIFTFGPRVMMSHEALQRSGLTSGYSLVDNDYRILLKDKARLAGFESAIKTAFPDMPWRIKTGTDGNRSVDRFIEQLTLFLTLSGLATFLIGGIGIGSAVRAYMSKKAETIAIMKTLGASRMTILRVYALVIGLLALMGSVIGIACSAAGAAAFLPFVSQFFPVHGGMVLDATAAALATWYGLLIAYLFSIPALLGALEVKPSLLFRSGVEMVALSRSWLAWAFGTFFAALLLGTLFLSSQDAWFIGGFVGVTLLSFVVFGTVSWLVKYIAKRVKVRSPWLRLALGNLHRSGNTTGTVILAIGVSLTVLIALTLTEANFQHKITRVVEAEAPTLFMIDIQPDQTDALQHMLETTEGARGVMMFPMMRGRILELNGKPVSPEDVKEDVRWAVRGDRGLSYSATPPDNAQIVQGEWWPQDYRGEPLVSIDERFIDGMGLELGDTITLDILGERLTATVASARRMDYTTFQLNFALMLSPGVIDDFPQTYLATVHLDTDSKAKAATIRSISEAFPNVTTIHTTEAVARVKEILNHIATALTITVLVSLLAGLLVLSSALSAMLGYRLYDTAVLKVLGARRHDILRAYTTEWMLLALITICVASAIGTFGAWLILQRFPGENTFFFMPEVTLITAGICIAVIWLVGYVGNRQVFRLRPASLLRNE
jgi:putative ABC transport system permease protein